MIHDTITLSMIDTSQPLAKLQKGFTIVELLIVIVIIGILITLVITGYNGIQVRAKDETVRSDLRNAATKFELYYVDFGRYPTTAALPSANIAASKRSDAYMVGSNFLYCATTNAASYALIARSESGTSYAITSLTKSVNVFSASVFPTAGSSANCLSAIGSSVYRTYGWNGTTWSAWVK